RCNVVNLEIELRCLDQRLSHKRLRCHVGRRTYGIPRQRRSKAADQYTDEKSENVLPHNCSQLRFQRTHHGAEKTPPSNPQREDLVTRQKKERAEALLRECKTANCGRVLEE